MKVLLKLICLLAVLVTALTVTAMPTYAQVCGEAYLELFPNSGIPGTNVTVKGHVFNEQLRVTVYFDETRVATAETGNLGSFTTSFLVPESCKGIHVVRAEDEEGRSASEQFTVKPRLTVTPESGPVGTNVTVRGQGFGQNEQGIDLRYYTGSSYQTVASNITANDKGSWRITLPIPTSTKGEHKLDAQGAASTLSDVKEAIFTVTAGITVDKSAGNAGETITIRGSHFSAYERDIKIWLAGETVVTGINADARGEWEETFDVPEMPSGNYTITVEGQVTRREDIAPVSFEIKPSIVLSPDEGCVGADLTVVGRGFAARTDVIIKYDGRQVARASTNDKGSFETSFPVPASRQGERVVTAGYAGQDRASAVFTMESQPPDVPVLISPANGSRVGFPIGAKPTFEWSAVSDVSGVRYSLQILSGADSSTSSVVFSVTGLTETSYTLERALDYGTYYWRVQAVDGAENPSGWTPVRSFGAGLLPLWGFIVTLTALAGGIIALIRFLLIRKGIYR